MNNHFVIPSTWQSFTRIYNFQAWEMQNNVFALAMLIQSITLRKNQINNANLCIQIGQLIQFLMCFGLKLRQILRAVRSKAAWDVKILVIFI